MKAQVCRLIRRPILRALATTLVVLLSPAASATPFDDFGADPLGQWDLGGGPLTWSFSVDDQPLNWSTNDLLQTMTAAFNVWDATAADIDFSLQGVIADPAFSSPATDGTNIRIYFDNEFSSNTGTGPGTIALATHALFNSGGQYPEIRGSDIVLNSEHFTFVDGAAETVDSGEADLLSILVHEIGHSLGLEHSTNPDSSVYWAYSGGIEERTLDPVDIAAIEALYPIGGTTPPDPGGPGDPTDPGAGAGDDLLPTSFANLEIDLNVGQQEYRQGPGLPLPPGSINSGQFDTTDVGGAFYFWDHAFDSDSGLETFEVHLMGFNGFFSPLITDTGSLIDYALRGLDWGNGPARELVADTVDVSVVTYNSSNGAFEYSPEFQIAATLNGSPGAAGVQTDSFSLDSLGLGPRNDGLRFRFSVSPIAAAVPEPWTFALLLVALSLLHRRRTEPELRQQHTLRRRSD